MLMIQRKTFVTALSGVLVGGLLLSGGMAIAGDTGSSVSDKLAGKMPFFGKMMKHRGGMAKGGGIMSEATLKEIVEKGIINQEQSDKILKRFADASKEQVELKQKMENMTLKEIRLYMQDNKGKSQNPFQGLVSDGVITQKQLDEINNFKRETAQNQRQQKMSTNLKALVDKGTITQEQSDKIIKKIEAVNKEKLQNPISQLVADGTITQAQADALGKILPLQKGFKGGHGGPGGFKGSFGGGFRGEKS